MSASVSVPNLGQKVSGTNFKKKFISIEDIPIQMHIAH
jgi:hypothetical protein